MDEWGKELKKGEVPFLCRTWNPSAGGVTRYLFLFTVSCIYMYKGTSAILYISRLKNSKLLHRHLCYSTISESKEISPFLLRTLADP
jgi:hypothetical protein